MSLPKHLEHFFAVPSIYRFIYRPLREIWPRESIDSILPPIPTGQMKGTKPVMMKPSDYLMQDHAVDQITWMPGAGEVIADKILTDGGWEDRPGARVYNQYQPPQVVPGDASQAAPFVNIVKRLYPEEAEQILDWMAFRVQHPGIKINHALVLGGGHGIGKDWLLEGLKTAVGPANYQTARPDELGDKNNPFVKAVILNINEAHDLGEGVKLDRYKFYQRIKTYAAAPPVVLQCQDKWVKRHYIPNVLGLAITTNHKTDGLYLDPDDRRHLVCWSNVRKEDFTEDGEWKRRYDWLQKEGGDAHIAAYLRERDVSKFDSGEPPKQTAAFFEIVSASAAPEDADLDNALDELGTVDKDGKISRPEAVTVAMLLRTSCAGDMRWLENCKRTIPYRMERCGYAAVKNPSEKKGRWRINRTAQMIYARADLSPVEREQAVWRLMQKARATSSIGF